MENIEEVVRGRRSVRNFDGKEISSADLEKITSYISKTENPYGIPVEFRMLNAKTQGLSCPVVNGTDIYIGGKIRNVLHAEEAFGYSFEMLVLYAQSLGLGTVWVGGTMDRSAFERAMELQDGEMMPCVTPLGYTAAKMSIKETVMRKAIKADSRQPFESLFFDGSFNTPLTEEKAGKLRYPLEMVRWAPSAVNKQPWRVVVEGNAVHFYKKKNIKSSSFDIQKVDLGIALCHFDLASKEKGIDAQFIINDPKIAKDDDMEYIASYLI